MRIAGHGIDLVEVARIARLVDEHGQRFLDRCFTAHEQQCAQDTKRRNEHLAARFAAKEAVLKAMGLGLGACRWHDIEVVRADSGRPALRLSGAALAASDERGIERWLLTLTHTALLAEAVAVAL